MYYVLYDYSGFRTLENILISTKSKTFIKRQFIVTFIYDQMLNILCQKLKFPHQCKKY